MVNTFLPHPLRQKEYNTGEYNTGVYTEDLKDIFQNIARDLDFRRVQKQWVEAKQIILLHEDLELLEGLLDFPIRVPDETVQVRIKLLVRKYKELGYYYTRNLETGDLGKIEKTSTLPIKEPRSEIRVLKLGFCYHPAVRMWFGYTNALRLYHDLIKENWTTREFKSQKIRTVNPLFRPTEPLIVPPWFGRPDIHTSHRSKLVEKYPEHYGKLYSEQPGLSYVWP